MHCIVGGNVVASVSMLISQRNNKCRSCQLKIVVMVRIDSTHVGRDMQ
jgi:DNA-directed RNA polymerase subunit RPC12/RpoP